MQREDRGPVKSSSEREARDNEMHGYLSEEDFRRLIDEAFAPFLCELGFRLSEFKTTNIWRFAEFAGHGLVIEVMYEFPMHYADVRVQTTSNVWQPRVHQGTIVTLSSLREQYSGKYSADELAENDQYFAGIDFACSEASRMLVMARQLRVVLPRWIKDHREV